MSKTKTSEGLSPNNLLIAQFMGYELVEVGYIGTSSESKWQKDNQDWSDNNGLNSIGSYIVNVPQDKWYECDKVGYNSDYSWLMEVVEKIESLRFQFVVYNAPHGCNVKISQGYIEIEGTTGQRTFRNCSVEGGKINALYLAVIDFINWYNWNVHNNLLK